MRKVVVLFVIVVLVLAGAGAGWRWWTEWRFVESTDDAYVESDTTIISPKIEGYIKTVPVDDNQRVAAGQPLVTIDDRDFKAKVAQAEAVVATAQATVATYESRLKLQQSMIDQAGAVVKSAEADLNRAQLDLKRYTKLVTADVATKQQFDTSQADALKAEAALAKAHAALVAEQNQVGVIQAQKHEEEARLAQARAALQLARNDLDNTVIRAPVVGVTGNGSAEPGQYVKPGMQLMVVVPLPYVYITANFKETQLTHMRTGQTAEIAVDAYPDQPLKGRIESFAPASGAQFSLLPPDNATGNFTKIVQRVPIRIRLPADAPLMSLLRPGLSVTVSIDTRTAPSGEANATPVAGALIGEATAAPAASGGATTR
jgi:membrane fusion protein (multidrug efflux system)